ncbi:MAG: serine hydrolase [Leeuwenhoekiella sp.]
MKYIARFFLGLITILLVLIIGLYVFGYGYLLTAVRTIYLTGHTTAYLEDYKKFDNVIIDSGASQSWPMTLDYNEETLSKEIKKIHEKFGTIAYVVIKNDSIVHESYYDGFGENSKSNSFSMAKSYVTGMLGKAIMQGHIESLDQPVCDFLPEYCGGLAGEMTVGDLASMASGLDWNESYYSPFSVTTQAYFDDDLTEIMLDLEVTEEPGQEYKYLSGNTQLLAIVLEKATGMPLEDYLSQSFWQPLGANRDALWQVDSKENNLVKAYCCIASNAKDFARFGKLYKDFGRWNGVQVLDSSFVARSIRPRFEGAPYGYGFWLKEYNGKDVFMMRGHLGQYVMVIPQDDLIVVRLGHSRGSVGEDSYPDEINSYLDEAYRLTQ